MDEQQRVTATAQADQLRAEMDHMLVGIIAKVKSDIASGKDKSMIYAMLVKDCVKYTGLPKQAAGTYLLAASILQLASRPYLTDGSDEESW